MQQKTNQALLTLLIIGITADANQAKAGDESPTSQRIQSAQQTQRLGQSDNTEKAYYADLGRRIKRAWFPPKGNESKRVVVIFRVNQGGEMTNLRISTSSGVAVADNAALKAVENAAPFRPLPAGSPEHRDYEFTFDYNTFAGGGGGSLRPR
jgi:TonB family protein